VIVDDEHFMREALALARAAPFTSPNPRVGAVLVRDGRVISRGMHRGAGTPHAEAVALAGTDARTATMYVTLEPCSFFGRTPPCAPAVIASGITRVVVAMEDPDERVAGRGLAAMRAAGLEVVTGVLEEAARRLNVAFIHHRTTGLPLVILKLAFTLDGRLAARGGSSRWITSPETRLLVHEARAASDAVLVGAGTVLVDDPSLTVRDIESSRQPARVVVDARGRVPPTAAVFASAHDAKVLVATSATVAEEVQAAWKNAGAEVLLVSDSKEGIELSDLLTQLGGRDLTQVYCEGGARLATSLLKQGLVDRLELHYGAKMVGDGGPSIGDLGVTTMGGARRWTIASVSRVDQDLLVSLEPVG
jgi:diaminohydroxyphosphoribosylaminopyrimidine deaminase/5-amino-6-(5-phosphoribosylamino)uracil reductase